MESNFYPDIERLLAQRPHAKTSAERINRIADAAMRAQLIERVLQGATYREISAAIGEWHRQRQAEEAARKAARTVAPAAGLKSLVRQAEAIKKIMPYLTDAERGQCREHAAALQQVVTDINAALGE